MRSSGSSRPDLPPFDRRFFGSSRPMSRIGSGELGGKARGLILIQEILDRHFAAARFPGVEIYVPRMAVVATDVFDGFMTRNRLWELALSEPPDDRLAEAFLRADSPPEILGDLRALVEEVRSPLAVRSSSLLEDALERPFAGVYGTKMVPNNQPDADSRFRKLMEAVKFVYASTFFGEAVGYRRATGGPEAGEKMAVVIQEVVGDRHGERHYPHLSGVARSYNFFPARGADPRDGVVNLALGLGKTIVDGGVSWIYSPARPQAPPPFGSVRDVLRLTQLEFWAVNMGRPPAFDPAAETEYLIRGDLAAADYDGTLAPLASTYDAERDRLVPGTGSDGPRVVDFAPLLRPGGIPLNAIIRELLAAGEEALGEAVEIEFAATLPSRGKESSRLGVLQLRPMMVSGDQVDLTDEELASPDLLLASSRVMGNGVEDAIRDIVYVKPGTFEARLTRIIAGELERVNRELVAEGRPYLLLGFGRWGSSDPWLGIPVNWGQIGGARAIVEATLPGMDVEPSQGAHFFHNIISFRVPYLCVHHERPVGEAPSGIAWSRLESIPALRETEHVRHVRLQEPLKIKVDGRAGRGGVWLP